LGIEIGIAEKLAIKALAIVTAVKELRIADEYKRRGDLGDAAEALLAGKTQVGLRNERLTVEEVYGILDRIAKSSGTGSVESKIRSKSARKRRNRGDKVVQSDCRQAHQTHAG